MIRTYEENHQINQTLWTPTGRTRAYMVEVREPEVLDSQVKFLGDRRWWNVRASNDQYAVLTTPGYFGREMQYTIIDWNEGRRGPHDSWGYGTITDEDCAEALDAITTGDIHLSERYSIYLDFKATR